MRPRRNEEPKPCIDWQALADQHQDDGPADCLCDPCWHRRRVARPLTEWQKYLAGYASKYDGRPWVLGGPNLPDPV